MSNTVQLEVCGKHHELDVKEYNGQRVVTFKDIDMLHQRPDGTARRNFNENKTRFVLGEDFYVRNSYEAKSEFGITAPHGLILLTESGYLMLVKSFTDDLAWEVQRQLVNTYFRVKETMQYPKTPAELMLMAAQQLVEHEKKIKELEERTEAAHHRIDNIDKIDILGDPQQRLNKMIRKYAVQNGLTFQKAWRDFKQAFNTAYRTNITMLVENYKLKHGLKQLSVPEYLARIDRLDDAIRVADKLLNQAS